jgi:hypothetical protein
MRFREWRVWAGSLPWSARWFVYLVLLRPVFDAFYGLKERSPILSPIYVVGVLTPILIVGALISGTLRRPRSSLPDVIMLFWMAILLINAVLVAFTESAAYSAEIGIKFLTPALIYFFLRRVIVSERDLRGVLQAALYSAIVPAMILLYELVINPIQVSQSRGLDRFQGLYADVVSYSIYFLCAYLISAYFFVSRDGRRFVSGGGSFMLTIGVLLLALLSIQHATSWIIALAISLLLVANTMSRKQLPAFVMSIVLFAAVYFWLGDTIADRATAIFRTDVAVIAGEREVGSALHGRVSRWARYLGYWEDLPVTAKLIGVSVSGDNRMQGMVLNAIHNDFLRIGFASGIIGLGAYFSWCMAIVMRSFSKPVGGRFVIHAAFAALFLYSVTTLPTLYPAFFYTLMAVAAYAALPSPRRNMRAFDARERLGQRRLENRTV